MTVFAWAYVRFGSLPAFPHFFEGIKPVVLALIAHALVSLGRTAVKNRFLLALGLAALAATFFVNELVLLLVAGCVSVGVMVLEDLLRKGKRGGTRAPGCAPERASTARPAPAAERRGASPLTF